ncbi:MAG TPA: DUF5004 domain-containing protein [Flavisolibacter sp.]|nr:DUF5004 domain-containing protein [Flavisolibacter sp.]
MPKKTFLVFMLAAITIVGFSSCTKDDTISNSQELIGTWQVTGISSDMAYDWDNDGYTETDIFATYDYCQRDITLMFDEGGYGQAQQGCNAAWEHMNWQLSNNNSRLDIYMTSGDINLVVTQFNGNTIRGYDQVQANGRTYNINYTLSKQY